MPTCEWGAGLTGGPIQSPRPFLDTVTSQPAGASFGWCFRCWGKPLWHGVSRKNGRFTNLYSVPTEKYSWRSMRGSNRGTILLGGGFNCFLRSSNSSLFGEDWQFDTYFQIMVEITTLYWLKISTMMCILFANVMKVGCAKMYPKNVFLGRTFCLVQLLGWECGMMCC